MVLEIEIEKKINWEGKFYEKLDEKDKEKKIKKIRKKKDRKVEKKEKGDELWYEEEKKSMNDKIDKSLIKGREKKVIMLIGDGIYVKKLEEKRE
jgi:hypothetical protein